MHITKIFHYILGTVVLLSIAGCSKKPAKIHPHPTVTSSAFWDGNTEGRPASYLYSPGLMGSEALMCRFNPSFTASTGEKIACTIGGHVIGEPHTATIFPDIDINKPSGFTLNPLTAYMNGARRDLFPLVERFFHESYGITVIDNPKSSKSVLNYTPRFTKANIGQRKDINCLAKTYKKHLAQYPGTDIVLYGDSRGAATTFNFIALHKPAQVKAAVLDGIFDSVPHCVKHFLYNDKGERAEKRLHDTLCLVAWRYKKNGPSPLDYAEKITDDIPLLLVTSLNDQIVPPQCTINLYKKLISRGLKKVHLLILNKASHPCYMIHNEEDRTRYEAVVHAFYKQYGLPYNRAKAETGEQYFLKTQPTVTELQTLNLAPCTLCTQQELS